MKKIFFNAIRNNLIDVVGALLDKGADLDWLDENGDSVTLNALKTGSPELVEFLVIDNYAAFCEKDRVWAKDNCSAEVLAVLEEELCSEYETDSECSYGSDSGSYDRAPVLEVGCNEEEQTEENRNVVELLNIIHEGQLDNGDSYRSTSSTESLHTSSCPPLRRISYLNVHNSPILRRVYTDSMNDQFKSISR